MARRGDAEQLGRHRRRRSAGQLHFGVRPGARACLAAQAAERFYRALPDSAPARVRTQASRWSRARRRSGCRRRPSCSTARAGSPAGGGAVPRTAGSSAWNPWCSAAPPWASAASAGIAARPDPGAPRAGGCCCTMRCGWRATWPPPCARPAIAAGARAVATIVHVAPDAGGTRLARRPRLALEGRPDAGASAWDGMLLARILAADGATLAPAGHRGLARCCAATRACRAYGCC